MANTRKLVLKNLLNKQRCTINDLADAVNINPISVRHHITRLEADGLVASIEERHGVGRPRRIYYLTKEGMEQFPSRYINISLKILEKLKDNMESNTVRKLFEEIAENIVKDNYGKVDLESFELNERVELTRKLLINEGFNVETEKVGDTYIIKELSCPYINLSQEHREFCIIDKTIISNMLSVPVRQTNCVLDGDPYCSYTTMPLETEEPQLNLMESIKE